MVYLNVDENTSDNLKIILDKISGDFKNKYKDYEKDNDNFRCNNSYGLQPGS